MCCNAYPVTLSAKEDSHYYHVKVFGMFQSGIGPTTSRMQNGRSIITPPRRSDGLEVWRSDGLARMCLSLYCPQLHFPFQYHCQTKVMYVLQLVTIRIAYIVVIKFFQKLVSD